MFTHISEIQKVFNDIAGLKVLVIGDVMIDSYIWGKVDRISPEAPVPVVLVSKRDNRPGGAANVALNIQALGATPILCSVIGNDMRSSQLTKLLESNNLSAKGILTSDNRITTIKFRVIGNKAHMLRVDEETDQVLNDEDTDKLLELIKLQISQKIDAIIFEDYDKGVITEKLIQQVVELASKHEIPVAVDPKKRNFKNYSGVSLFKPNLKELKNGLKLDSTPKPEELQEILSPFMESLNIKIILTTLSEAGIYICQKNASGKFSGQIIPAHIRNIADVSGAGDTVISTATLGLAAGLEPFEAAALANLAGGLVCEEIGVVPVNKSKLYNEAINKLLLR